PVSTSGANSASRIPRPPASPNSSPTTPNHLTPKETNDMSHTTEDPLPPQLLSHLRQLAPKRALTYSESITIAQYQAVRLRELLGVTPPAMPLGWVPELPKVTLKVIPAYQLGDGTSGLTTRENGHYLIAVNKNRPRVHRRFTLAHELKH